MHAARSIRVNQIAVQNTQWSGASNGLGHRMIYCHGPKVPDVIVEELVTVQVHTTRPSRGLAMLVEGLPQRIATARSRVGQNMWELRFQLEARRRRILRLPNGVTSSSIVFLAQCARS